MLILHLGHLSLPPALLYQSLSSPPPAAHLLLSCTASLLAHMPTYLPGNRSHLSPSWNANISGGHQGTEQNVAIPSLNSDLWFPNI